MISRVDFIHKDNIAIGTVAKSYTSVYDFEYPTQKFNEDYNWFAVAPSTSSFMLILDTWLMGLYRDTEYEKTKFSDYVVKIYDDNVLIMTGIMEHESMSLDLDNNTFSATVSDFLVLLTNMDDISFDFHYDDDFQIDEVTVNREIFLNDYCHTPTDLLKTITAISAQKYFNPTPFGSIEMSSAVENRFLAHDYVSLYKDKLYRYRLSVTEPNDGYAQYTKDKYDASGVLQNTYFASGVTDIPSTVNNYTADCLGVSNYSIGDDGYIYYLVRSKTSKPNIYRIDIYRCPADIIGSLALAITNNINFTSKANIPYTDFLPECSDLKNPNIRPSISYAVSNPSNQAIESGVYIKVDGNKTIFYIIDIIYATAPTYRDEHGYSDYRYQIIGRQEKRVFIGYAEVLDEKEIKGGSYTSPYDATYENFEDVPSYIIAKALHYMDMQLDVLPLYQMQSYRDYGWSYGQPSTAVVNVRKIADGNTYDFKLTIDRLKTQQGMDAGWRTLAVTYTGATSSIYLNYKDAVSPLDVLDILTKLHNCSYRYENTVFCVSDKNYINNPTSLIPVSSDLIGVERTVIRAETIENSVLEKIVVNDILVYKGVVTDYYKSFFNLVKFAFSCTISSVFNNNNLSLGGMISYDGKYYIVSEIKKEYDNIYKIRAFNGYETVLQLSSDGVNFADAELSENGTDFVKWVVRSI